MPPDGHGLLPRVFVLHGDLGLFRDRITPILDEAISALKQEILARISLGEGKPVTVRKLVTADIRQTTGDPSAVLGYSWRVDENLENFIWVSAMEAPTEPA